MASFDSTAAGIVGCVIVAGAYSVIRGVRHRTFDFVSIPILFLAGYAVPVGSHLIMAAWTGNQSDLPASWREYVGVAGVVGIGLSFKLFLNCFLQLGELNVPRFLNAIILISQVFPPRKASLLDPRNVDNNALKDLQKILRQCLIE